MKKKHYRRKRYISALLFSTMHIAYTVFHETGDTVFVVISLSTDFQNPVSFSSKFAVKRLLKIPSRLAYVATIPCETLMSTKNKRLTMHYKAV